MLLVAAFAGGVGAAKDQGRVGHISGSSIATRPASLIRPSSRNQSGPALEHVIHRLGDLECRDSRARSTRIQALRSATIGP